MSLSRWLKTHPVLVSSLLELPSEMSPILQDLRTLPPICRNRGGRCHIPPERRRGGRDFPGKQKVEKLCWLLYLETIWRNGKLQINLIICTDSKNFNLNWSSETCRQDGTFFLLITYITFENLDKRNRDKGYKTKWTRVKRQKDLTQKELWSRQMELGQKKPGPKELGQP